MRQAIANGERKRVAVALRRAAMPLHQDYKRWIAPRGAHLEINVKPRHIECQKEKNACFKHPGAPSHS